MVIDTLFVYYFIDPDLDIELFFKKRGAIRQKRIDLEKRVEAPTANYYWG